MSNNISYIALNILNEVLKEAQDEWLDRNSMYIDIR